MLQCVSVKTESTKDLLLVDAVNRSLAKSNQNFKCSWNVTLTSPFANPAATSLLFGLTLTHMTSQGPSLTNTHTHTHTHTTQIQLLPCHIVFFFICTWHKFTASDWNRNSNSVAYRLKQQHRNHVAHSSEAVANARHEVRPTAKFKLSSHCAIHRVCTIGWAELIGWSTDLADLIADL